MVNVHCTACGEGWDRRGVHVCRQQRALQENEATSLTPKAIFDHIMRRDEEMVKEHVKQILQQMVCKIIEHVPINIDDRAEEIIDSCRGLRLK